MTLTTDRLDSSNLGTRLSGFSPFSQSWGRKTANPFTNTCPRGILPRAQLPSGSLLCRWAFILIRPFPQIG